MEVIKHDPTIGQASTGVAAPEQQDFSAREVTISAFSQENDLVNLAQFAMRPSFEREEGFDIVAATEGNQLVNDYADVLGKAQSQAELDFIMSDIQTELRNKEVLAGSGFGGFVASAAAGMISPTSLVPMMGPARGVKGAAQAFALAGGTIAAQEAALYGMQTTRTPEEVMTGIAIGTVLGGLLGTAARELTPSQRIDLESGMASKRGVTTILHTDPETGQSSRIDFNTLEEVLPEPILPARDPLDDVQNVADGSSIARTLSNEAPTARYSAADLAQNTRVYEAAKQIAPKLMSEFETAKKSVGQLREQLVELRATRWTDITETFSAMDTRLASLQKTLKDTKGKGNKAKLRKEIAEVKSDRALLAKENPLDETVEMQNVRKELMSLDERLRDLGKQIGETYSSARAKIDGGDAASASVKQQQIEQLMDDYIDQLDVNAPKQTVETVDRKVSMRDSDSTAGALDIRGTRDRGLKKSGISGKAIGVLAKLNPVTRILENNVSTMAKVWMERIQLPGVKMDGVLGADSAAGDGFAYSRALTHQKAIVDFITQFDDAYARHFHDGKVPEGELQTAWLETVKGRIGGLPAGKMSYEDFNKTVFDLANTGEKHVDPAVNKAVKSLHDYFKYSDDLADRYFKERQLLDGDDAKPLYERQEFSQDNDIQHYVHHSFDPVQVVDNMDEFLKDFAANGEGLMKARFAKAHADMIQARNTLADRAAIHQLPTEQLKVRSDDVTVRIEELEEKHIANLEREKDYRARMKEAGYDKKELADAMKTFRQGLPDDFANDMRTLRKLQREGKDLTKLIAKKPAARAKDAEDLLAKRDELETTFTEHWEAEGAMDLRALDGTADFSAQAMDDATNLFRRISGQRDRIAGMDVLADRRGPQLQRMLDMPFAVKKKYLVNEPEKLVRMHGYTMFPDLELYRISGSANGARIFKDINDDLVNTIQKYDGATHMLNGRPVRRVKAGEGEQIVEGGVKNAAKKAGQDLVDVLSGDFVKVRDTQTLTPITKESRADIYRKLRVDADAVLRDMRVVVDRMRHHRGVPKDGDSFGYRAGRVAMNANVMRYMGSVAISSVPDMARPVMKYGLGKTFRHAWKPLVTDMAQTKMARAEARRAGIALDPMLHNRAQAIFDVNDNHALRQNMVERGVEFLANKTGFVGLFDRWTAEMKHMATNVTFAEFGAAFKGVADSTATKKQLDMLEAVGLNDNMVRRIWKQYQKEGGSTEFDDGMRLPNTEAWDDHEAVMALRASIVSMTDDLIVTPGLDRPNWMDENQAFRMVAQFRSFTFTATNRIVMSGLQEKDMAFMQGAIMSLGLGAISYYTWAASVGGSTWERAQNAESEQIIYEAFARSGLLGVLSEGQRIGEQIPGLNDWAVFGGEGRPSRRADSVLGAVLGPSYDLAEKLVTVAQGMSEPTQSTLHTARTAIVPYQNVFYFRKLLDAMEEGVSDLMDLPETRG